MRVLVIQPGLEHFQGWGNQTSHECNLFKYDVQRYSNTIVEMGTFFCVYKTSHNSSRQRGNYSKRFFFQKPGENLQFCSPQHVQVFQRHISISFQQNFLEGEKGEKDHNTYSGIELEPHINKGFLLNSIWGWVCAKRPALLISQIIIHVTFEHFQTSWINKYFPSLFCYQSRRILPTSPAYKFSKQEQRNCLNSLKLMLKCSISLLLNSFQ